MNKTELIAAVAEKAGLTKKDVEKTITATLETIKEVVAEGSYPGCNHSGIQSWQSFQGRCKRRLIFARVMPGLLSRAFLTHTMVKVQEN